VSGRLDMAVTDLGPTQLKNIERSIRVYSLEVGKPAIAKPATETRSLEKRPEPKRRSAHIPLALGIAALLVLIGAGAWYLLAGSRTAPIATRPPNWTSGQMAGVRPEATRVFGRNAQIAAIRGRRGDSQNSPWKSYVREERCAKSSRNRAELTRYPA